MRRGLTATHRLQVSDQGKYTTGGGLCRVERYLCMRNVRAAKSKAAHLLTKTAFQFASPHLHPKITKSTHCFVHTSSSNRTERFSWCFCLYADGDRQRSVLPAAFWIIGSAELGAVVSRLTVPPAADQLTRKFRQSQHGSFHGLVLLALAGLISPCGSSLIWHSCAAVGTIAVEAATKACLRSQPSIAAYNRRRPYRMLQGEDGRMREEST